MKISIVVAVSRNGIIGKDGKTPWHVAEDLKHFKNITSPHHVLMGRKTFESIGRSLPKRTNLVLSTNPNFNAEGVIVFQDFGDAVKFAKERGEEELMVIGGEKVFELALPQAEKIYQTLVLRNYEGNTRFSIQDPQEWKVTSLEKHWGAEPPFEYLTLERK